MSNRVISEDRTEVRLGELTFEYDASHNLVQVAKYDEEVFAAGEGCPPEMWEHFVKDLEEKINCGPLLTTLQRIREMGKDAKRVKSQEERGERGSRALQPGVEAFMQLGIRVDGLVSQVLEEYERTSPVPEDTFGISTLDAESAPRGLAPPEIVAVLSEESARINAQVTVLNWQVTEVQGKRVIFVLLSYEEPQRADSTRIRTATYVDGECLTSGDVV